MASFMKRLAGLFKSATSGSILLKLLDQNSGKEIEDNYKAYATHGYAGNPFVYACVREIATSGASIPWKVMTKSTNPLIPDQQVIKPNDPLARLIKNPAPMVSWQEFVEELITHLQIGGEAFIRGVFVDNNSRVARLQLLRPDRVEVKASDDMLESRTYTYTLDDKIIGVYDSNEVLHIKFTHPLDDLRGLSPMRSARRSIQSNNEARRWNQSLLQNDARPSGAFSVKGDLSDIQINAMRDLISRKFTSPENARKPLLLQGETQWVNFGYSPGEMDWLGGMDVSTREICSSLNVPEELVGGSRKTYENYYAALKGLYTENILPLLDMIGELLNLWLVPRVAGVDSGMYLKYDATVIDVLQDEADKLYKRANVSTYMTIDERRAIVGLAPLGDKKGGGVILISTASVPLERLMNEPINPPAPPAPKPPQDQSPEPQSRQKP